MQPGGGAAAVARQPIAQACAAETTAAERRECEPKARGDGGRRGEDKAAKD